MMKAPYLTIIIPCFNEQENINRQILSGLRQELSKYKFEWEVVISDDGSTDKSIEVIKSQIKDWDNFRLLENPHGGKPSALWFGIKNAKGKHVLFSDMDQSTPIMELEKLLPFVDEKTGAVIGSRGLLRRNFPLYRRLGSILFMAFRKIFILPEIDDTQCGFKLFIKNVVEKAFPHLQFFKNKKELKGWSVTSFDVELLHIIKKMGYKIEEVPVDWKDNDASRGKGGSLGRYAKESKEMLLQIARVKLNDMRGFYNNI